MQLFPETPGGRARCWFGLAVALLLYVLSVGPAIRICVRTQNLAAQEVSGVIYSPLVALEETPFGTALGRWVRWCYEFPASAEPPPRPTR